MKLVKYTHTTFLLKSVKKTILKDTHEDNEDIDIMNNASKNFIS